MACPICGQKARKPPAQPTICPACGRVIYPLDWDKVKK